MSMYYVHHIIYVTEPRSPTHLNVYEYLGKGLQGHSHTNTHYTRTLFMLFALNKNYPYIYSLTIITREN